MAAISNLPPLRSDKDSIPPPETAGVWVRRSGASLLRKIADSLDHKDQAVDGLANAGGEDATRTASIPDVWAQAEVFRSALFYDGADPSRIANKARAVAEWRGLLALLALKDRNSYTLQALPIDFTALSTAETEDTVEPIGASSMFLAVCGQLLPRGVAFKDHSWRNIAILKVSGETVGLLVPTTLVVPARDYDVRLANTPHYIPWFKGGVLRDPVSPTVGLRPRDYLLLSAFLKELLDTVRKTAPDQDEMHNGLIGLLAAFELDSRRLGTQTGLGDALIKRNGSLGLDLPKQSVYVPLNYIFHTAGGAEHQTRVRPRSLWAHKFNGVILHDSENGFRQLPGHSENLVLWGDLTQKRAMLDGAALLRAEADARAQGYLFLDVAKLFSPRLMRIGGSGRAVEQGSSLEGYVLPLSPLVLLLFEPEDLKHAVRIEKTAKGDFRVALSLDLLDQQGKLHATYAAERIYREDLKQVEERAVPVGCSVWPDFRTENWQFYTAFHRGQPESDICLTGVLSPEALLRALPADAAPEQAVALISNWASGTPLGVTQVPIAHLAENMSDLFVSSAPIEALSCGIQPRSPKDKPVTLGFVLAPPTTLVPTTGNAAVIGVDFGTSNTCVYLKVGGHGTPIEAKFKNRQMLPLVKHPSGSKPEVVTIAYSDFMPYVDVEMPFLSLLKSREGDGGSVDENLPFGKSHIWFVSDLRESMDKALGNDRYLHFNLKWSKSADDRARLRQLLRDCALLGLVEAAHRGVSPKDVVWAFSYPLTQNFNEKDYRQSCQISVDAAREAATGQRGSATLINEITESEAAALYFRGHENMAFAGTTVTIDIGGGTSDISIWDGVDQVWRHSLELAGRRILLSYLRRRIDFFEALCRDPRQGSTLAYVKNQLGKPEFKAALASTPKAGANLDADDPITKMLEVVINSAEFREQFPRRLSDLSGESDGATLKWQATLALAGMVYFVGRQISAMKGQVAVSTDTGVTFCLSGRGSSLYRNLYSDVRELQQRLAFVFYRAAELPDSVPFNIVYSKDPKHEAAFGLVSDWGQTGDRPTLTLMGPKRLDSPIIGETLKIDGRELSASTLANATIGARKLELSGLSETENFLKIMEELTATSPARIRPDGVRVNIASHRATLFKQINQELERWSKNSDPTKPSVREPVFLVALRLLVDLVNDGDLKLVPIEQ